MPTAETGLEASIQRRYRLLSKYTSLRNKVVLDVGTGFGAYGNFASVNGAKTVVGIDLTREYLLVAKKFRGVHIVLCDALHLPFPDSMFDITVSIEVFEHLPNEQEPLQEIRRTAKNNGFFLLTVPNKFYPLDTHGFHVFTKTVFSVSAELGMPFLSWMPHFARKFVENAKIYTIKQVQKLLSNNGFDLVEVDYMMPPLERTDRIRSLKLTPTIRKLLTELEKSPLKYFGVSLMSISIIKKNSKLPEK